MEWEGQDWAYTHTLLFPLLSYFFFFFFPALAMASFRSKCLWKYGLILSFTLESGFSSKIHQTAMATKIEYNLLRR